MDRAAFLLLLLALAGLTAWLIPLRVWFHARAPGVEVSLTHLFAMRLRRVDPAHIVHALVTAHKAGVPLDAARLEAHHLAGGDVKQVVLALVAARLAGVDLDFRQAAAIDLAGHDVVKVVRSGPRRPDGSIDHPAVLPPRAQERAARNFLHRFHVAPTRAPRQPAGAPLPPCGGPSILRPARTRPWIPSRTPSSCCSWPSSG